MLLIPVCDIFILSQYGIKNIFFVLMQNEVKKVKIVGILPSNFEADDGRSYPGFRIYCTQENENAYGIATRSFWVKDAVYQEFIKKYYEGDPNRALGEEIEVACDFNGKPNRLLPYSLFK